MATPAENLVVTRLSPREAARLVVESRQGDPWLDAFAEQLDRHRAGQALARTLQVWDLSQSAAARLFGVSRQAVSKWMEGGAPAERAAVIADLSAATDLLVHYLKRDRIPAVVRRPVARLGGHSLLDLLQQGRSHELLQACRDMFSFDQAHA